METYVSRVTAAGQMTLPKKVRRSLGIEGAEYVEVAMVGRAAIIRRLREEDEFLRSIRRKIKKSGLTRAKVQEIVEETRKRTWKRRNAQTLR
jgi:AbrB family looped-hinge helix DNA binding protein